MPLQRRHCRAGASGGSRRRPSRGAQRPHQSAPPPPSPPSWRTRLPDRRAVRGTHLNVLPVHGAVVGDAAARPMVADQRLATRHASASPPPAAVLARDGPRNSGLELPPQRVHRPVNPSAQREPAEIVRSWTQGPRRCSAAMQPHVILEGVPCFAVPGSPRLNKQHGGARSGRAVVSARASPAMLDMPQMNHRGIAGPAVLAVT